MRTRKKSWKKKRKMKTTERRPFIDGVLSEHRAHRRVGRITAALMIVILAAPVVFFAEEASPKEYALLYGTVWGADNRPVSGIVVKIQRAGDEKPRWRRVSDRRGEFAARVPAGAADYVLFTEVGSGKSKKRLEVKAHIESNERVDVSLHLED